MKRLSVTLAFGATFLFTESSALAATTGPVAVAHADSGDT